MSTRTITPNTNTNTNATARKVIALPGGLQFESTGSLQGDLNKLGASASPEHVNAILAAFGLAVSVGAAPATTAPVQRNPFAPRPKERAEKSATAKDTRTPEQRYYLTNIETVGVNQFGETDVPIRIGISNAPDTAPREKSGFAMIAPQNYRGTVHVLGVLPRSTVAMDAASFALIGNPAIVAYLTKHQAYIVQCKENATNHKAEKLPK